MKYHELKLTLNGWWRMSWRSGSPKANIYSRPSSAAAASCDYVGRICAHALNVLAPIKRLIAQIKFSYQFFRFFVYVLFIDSRWQRAAPRKPLSSAQCVDSFVRVRILAFLWLSMCVLCVCHISGCSRRQQLKPNNGTLVRHSVNCIFHFPLLFRIIKFIVYYH